MKKLTYLLATAALFAACQGGTNGYTVTGTVEGAADGDTVYLKAREGRQLVNIDTAVIANGKFKFEGTQDSTALHYIACKAAGENGLTMEFFLENGKININLAKVDDSATGTPTNDIYQPVREKYNANKKQQMDLAAEIKNGEWSEEEKAAKLKAYEAIEENGVEIMKEAAKANITNAVGVTLLKSYYYYMDVEELDPLMPQIPATYDNDAAINRIKGNVEKMKKTAVGQKFTDFEMNDPEGNPVKLSDYVGKGKVVLVDFWASWCGPCRREMPNLVELYKQYKGKNFEIVGVSLDRDNDSWKKAIKDLGITWPQMSDLKFWDCEGAKLYAVSSIPHTMLVDGEGTILARGLHGDQLKEKVAEVLK